jgi:hypothetical protein
MHVSNPLSLLALLLLVLQQPLASTAVRSEPVPRADRVLDRLKEELTKNYAYKGKEEWLIQSLGRNQELGNYAELSVADLGAAITDDLRSWTSDKHFMVAYMPAFATELEEYAARPDADVDQPEDDSQEAVANFGIGRVEMLDEQVGLIQLKSIAFSPNTVPAFQDALASLPEAQALVLDLRDNHGGGADTVPGLASCFFPRGEKVTLATKYWRPDDEETLIETDPKLGGVRYLIHPIIILTSKDTRSAAEALAYHLRAFGLAFVVGEQTSGGAHPADMVSLGDGFVALIPMGWTISTMTGTDWEGRGVPIDLPCPPDEAERRGLDLAWRLLDSGR